MKKILIPLFIFIVGFLYSQTIDNTVYIQPLGEVSDISLTIVKNSIEKFYGYKCVVRPKIPFSDDLLAKSKTRYNASKILKKFDSNKNLLIITESDIAKKHRGSDEYGILGLGYIHGNTCVVSTFRMKRKVSKEKFHERLTKVSIHEVGHNLGLDHCEYDRRCLMNDARGTIKQIDMEKIWLCKKCTKQIGIKYKTLD
jgi:archaemetzincin